jgi:DNA invertase Pin-like site-specific DNA recombinase
VIATFDPVPARVRAESSYDWNGTPNRERRPSRSLRLTRTFDDAGVSGRLPLEQRPGLLAAIGKGGVLIVAKRDRLGRDLINVAMVERLIERRGGRIVSPDAPDTQDPSVRLMRQIIDCFAEYERAIIRARTSAALQAKKARGERVGGVPFGFQVAPDGSLVPQDAEQQALRYLRQARGTGKTLQAVADELNELGFRTRGGGLWRHQYVSRREARIPYGVQGDAHD